MTTLSVDFDAPTVEISEARLRKLRTFNAVMGVLHFISGTLMIVLGDTGVQLATSTFNINGPPGTPLSDGTLNDVGGISIAFGTAAFMYLSALFHFIIAAPGGFGFYSSELRRGRNRLRWVEYALSSSLMIVLIALITGITDVAALISIAFVNASMILFGWLMEMVNTPNGDRWWTPFWFGCVAGIGPWAAIAAYLVINSGIEGAEQPPTFVYGIIVTIFVFFNSFAINQWLQYKGIGKWKDYVFGETVYIVLSLLAKSALAWQIFANTLIPDA